MFRKLVPAAAATLALVAPALAHAASKVRVEWVRVASSPARPSTIFGAQMLVVSGAAQVHTNGAPFPGATGASEAIGVARVSVMSGAVIAAWGANPTATETTGLRLQQGDVVYVEIGAGQTVAFVEAADAASQPGDAHGATDAAFETPAPSTTGDMGASEISTALETASFGAETLSGFGGYHVVSLADTPVIVGQKNGAGAASTMWCVDPAGDVVAQTGTPGPNGVCPSTMTYGGVAPVYSGPYTLVLIGHTASGGPAATTLTINIQPYASTVKSHYGFTYKPDSPTSHQLYTVLNSVTNIHLGDTVVIRNGSGTTGPTPALNPKDDSTPTHYQARLPTTAFTQGGNTASSRITVTCDTQNIGVMDSNGNPTGGGGCTIGGMGIDGTRSYYGNASSPIATPIDFSYVTFERDLPSTVANYGSISNFPYSYQLSTSNYIWGVGCYNCRFVLGPAITAEEGAISNAKGYLAYGMDVENSHFVGAYSEAIGTSAPPFPGVPFIVKNNIFEGLESDAIDWTPSPNNSVVDIESNFFLNFNSLTPNANDGDQLIIDATANGGARSVYTFQANWDGQANHIPISVSWARTVANAVCTINGGVASPATFPCASGSNYPAGQPANGTVSAKYASTDPTWTLTVTALSSSTPGANVSLSVASNFSATLASAITHSTTLSSCGSSACGTFMFNPAHADAFQLFQENPAAAYPGPIFKYNISVRGSASPNTGLTQFYFGSPEYGCCFYNADIENNISHQIAGNQYFIQAHSNPTMAHNTGLMDATSNGYAPQDPTYDTIDNPIYQLSITPSGLVASTASGGSANVGGVFDHNLLNVVNLAALAGAPTITPNPNEAIPQQSTQAQDGVTLKTFMPALPASSTALTSRAAVIAAMSPALGSTFTGKLGSAGPCGNGSKGVCTLTVDGGQTVPAVGAPINGPGLPNGDPVWSVTGNVITLRVPATSTANGDTTYATGAMNPDGTYNGALYPADASGRICWNDGAAWSYTADCTATHTLAQ